MKDDKWKGWGPPPLWWDLYDWPPEFPAAEKKIPEPEKEKLTPEPKPPLEIVGG